MKYFNSAKVRVFAASDDSKEREALLSILPKQIKNPNIFTTHATGLEGQQINILELFLEKQSILTEFLVNIIGKLPQEDKKLLLEQIDSRVDERCHFFMRLDKESLFNGKFKLTESGNCFHLTMNIASFPAKKENAKKIIEKFLE